MVVKILLEPPFETFWNDGRLGGAFRIKYITLLKENDVFLLSKLRLWIHSPIIHVIITFKMYISDLENKILWIKLPFLVKI